MITLKGLEDISQLNNLGQGVAQQAVVNIAIDNIVPGKYQPRKQFNQASLDDLAKSIAQQGILQPLIIRADGSQFEIIAGERRWRAAMIAGLETVPAIIRNIDDETALAFAIIENLQREDLNPIDEAYAFERLRTEFGMTHEQIAESVGKSRTAITNYLRLLKLPQEIKNSLQQKKIEIGHARALINLDEESQHKLLKRIHEENYSVRETENRVKSIKNKSINVETHDEVVKLIQAYDLDLRYVKSIKQKNSGVIDITFRVKDKNDFVQLLKQLQTVD